MARRTAISRCRSAGPREQQVGNVRDAISSSRDDGTHQHDQRLLELVSSTLEPVPRTNRAWKPVSDRRMPGSVDRAPSPVAGQTTAKRGLGLRRRQAAVSAGQGTRSQ